VGERFGAGLRFCVLGPLVVSSGSEPVDPGPYKQRVLLGALLLRCNMVVSVDQLVQAVWPEGPPRTARKNLQVYISALRKTIGDRIQHASYGYHLTAISEELDLLAFDGLAAAGYAAFHAGNLPETRRLLGQAVGLWRGDALADLLRNPVIASESERLGQRYIAVYEDWVDLEIDAGQHLPIVGRLTAQARRHPFRERLTAATIIALHRAGRRREALATFEAHRQLIARELGLAPSPVLQRLYQTMLTGGPDQAMPRDQAPRVRLRPAQLPRDLPDFVGRTEQADTLAAALTGPAGTDVAVVTGATGTGKTALAIRVGHRLAAAFGDGHVFVSMRAADGTPRATRDVLTELMRATGLEIEAPREEGEALAVWRSWVAGREFLLILDDAAGEAQISELLPGNGRNRTLVTSSYRLSGLESVYRTETGELTHEESAELLARIIGRTRVVADALHRIIRCCGSTPLALRAVGTKLNVLRHLPMSDLADRLESAEVIFSVLADEGSLIRRRLRRYYADLSALQQQAVRRLATLPARLVSYDDLLHALHQLREPAVQVVERLIEANIVGVPEFDGSGQPVHYTVPMLIRQFAVELGAS
jgi:DNA-binding SARP family transcriptional activator